jgi:ABC-type lipoprotein export system ATPase subunit
MKKILELHGVSKEYKSGNTSTKALQSLTISLNEGESLAVVGTSGSGKSTLLNMIGGLDKPTTGKISINGKDITKLNDKELSQFRNKTIGFVFQFFNLQEYLSAYENVMVPMLFAGTQFSNAKERALNLLKKVGLEERVTYYPKQLSGGEMQRVAVARSLANEPKILLADEPTANLDRESANVVLDLFEEIAKTGVSVVVITHDPYVSRRFQNIINLEDGKLKSVEKNDTKK